MHLDKLDTLFCVSSIQETRFIEVLSDTNDGKDIISKLTSGSKYFHAN